MCVPVCACRYINVRARVWRCSSCDASPSAAEQWEDGRPTHFHFRTAVSDDKSRFINMSRVWTHHAVLPVRFLAPHAAVLSAGQSGIIGCLALTLCPRKCARALGVWGGLQGFETKNKRSSVWWRRTQKHIKLYQIMFRLLDSNNRQCLYTNSVNTGSHC